MTGQQSPRPQKKPSESLNLKHLLIAFLMPTLFGKTLVVFFGLQYTENPGEGYGWGLIGALLFTVSMLVRFVWRFRDYSE